LKLAKETALIALKKKKDEVGKKKLEEEQKVQDPSVISIKDNLELNKIDSQMPLDPTDFLLNNDDLISPTFKNQHGLFSGS